MKNDLEEWITGIYIEKLGITAELYKTIRLLGRLSAPFNVHTSSVVRSLRF